MILELNTKDGIDIWKAIPLCLMWCIWQEKKRGYLRDGRYWLGD